MVGERQPILNNTKNLPNTIYLPVICRHTHITAQLIMIVTKHVKNLSIVLFTHVFMNNLLDLPDVYLSLIQHNMRFE